eukprot:6469077-Amphidinium_carterae.1
MPSLALGVFASYFVEFMDLLGWQFTSKAPPSEVFDTLGVRFDLSGMVGSGRFWVRNLPRRVSSILQELDEIELAGELLPARAARLRGRLGFAGSQLFGRVGKVGLRVLSDRQYGGGFELSYHLLESFAWWRKFFELSPARTVELSWSGGPHIQLFTDGAVEGDAVSFGAVIARDSEI